MTDPVIDDDDFMYGDFPIQQIPEQDEQQNEQGLPIEPKQSLPMEPKQGLPIEPKQSLPMEPKQGLVAQFQHKVVELKSQKQSEKHAIPQARDTQIRDPQTRETRDPQTRETRDAQTRDSEKHQCDYRQKYRRLREKIQAAQKALSSDSDSSSEEEEPEAKAKPKQDPNPQKPKFEVSKTEVELRARVVKRCNDNRFETSLPPRNRPRPNERGNREIGNRGQIGNRGEMGNRGSRSQRSNSAYKPHGVLLFASTEALESSVGHVLDNMVNARRICVMAPETASYDIFAEDVNFALPQKNVVIFNPSPTLASVLRRKGNFYQMHVQPADTLETYRVKYGVLWKGDHALASSILKCWDETW